MKTQHAVIGVLVAVIFLETAALFGGLKQKLTKPVSLPPADFSVDMNADKRNAVTVNDPYLSGSGFSMTFPASWWFVTAEKYDLASDTPNPPQYVGYSFTPPRVTGATFEVFISDVNRKDHELVTQGGRVYLGENDRYVFNYVVSRDSSCGSSKAICDKVFEEMKREVGEAVSTFKLLSP